MSAEFVPGRPVTLAPGVIRLLAPNASRMTGPGTNSFLLGEPPRAVLDPGPDIDSHVEAILRAAPQLDIVIVTHTHPDHSPAVRRVVARRQASGAAIRVIGLDAPNSVHQDRSFSPTERPRRDQLIAIGAALTLRAIDTPGHASNHVCYLLEEQGLLFSGDHVLDGVTPVILAPDGDMAAYLESLERLARYPLRAIAPGHGRVLTEPGSVIAGVIAHRLRREQKVLGALAAVARSSPPGGTLEDLLGIVYDDVAPELHAMARHSLEAHLIKLRDERRARCIAERWHAA